VVSNTGTVIGTGVLKISELQLAGGKAEVKVSAHGKETATITFDYTIREIK
jgi:hypothetical protein